jgi:hypothetical protein
MRIETLTGDRVRIWPEKPTNELASEELHYLDAHAIRGSRRPDGSFLVAWSTWLARPGVDGDTARKWPMKKRLRLAATEPNKVPIAPETPKHSGILAACPRCGGAGRRLVSGGYACRKCGEQFNPDTEIQDVEP